MSIFAWLKSLFQKEEVKIIPGRDSWVESPKDYRDVPFGAIAEDITPPEEYQIPYKLTIKDQLQTYSCVGQASSSLKEAKERQEGNNIVFDGFWLYKKAKEIDGIPNFNGTYYRIGLKILQKIGAKPTNENEVDIARFRIGGYCRVERDFESLKRAIFSHCGVLAGYSWTLDEWNTAYVKPPKPGERKYGHAVFLVGYTKTHLIAQNSWGEENGDGGYYYIPKDYLPGEAWCVLIDLPNNWSELLVKNTPKPNHYFNKDLFITMSDLEVVDLKRALIWLGCLDGKSVGLTNLFGTKTKEAVMVFQKRNNLETTGRVGQLERDCLNKLFS
jgi:peptidoglycan hydrolase-like protein with peptidoglycan-binding domain